jgi:hypothetical protein
MFNLGFRNSGGLTDLSRITSAASKPTGRSLSIARTSAEKSQNATISRILDEDYRKKKRQRAYEFASQIGPRCRFRTPYTLRSLTDFGAGRVQAWFTSTFS